jgi:PAS domain S-box-containing protein
LAQAFDEMADALQLRAAEADAALKALSASEERFRQFADHSADVLWIADVKTRRLEYLSRAFDEIWAVPRDGVMADPAVWLAAIRPEDRTAAASAFPRACAGERTTVEYRVTGRNGKTRWIRDSAFPIRSEDGAVIRVAGIARDMTESKQAEQHQSLLLAEVSHRAKNTLGVVQGIAARSLSGDRTLEQAREAFMKRLGALATAHTLLTAREWRGATLRTIVEAELKPYGRRIQVDGPDLALSAKATITLILVVHELATNAAKYGALSTENGQVAVRWHVAQQATGPMLELSWREAGGPPVQAPVRKGFGRTLIEKGWRHELGGDVTLDFRPEGLTCAMRVPLSKILAEPEGGPAPSRSSQAQPCPELAQSVGE